VLYLPLPARAALSLPARTFSATIYFLRWAAGMAHQHRVRALPYHALAHCVWRAASLRYPLRQGRICGGVAAVR